MIEEGMRECRHGGAATLGRRGGVVERMERRRITREREGVAGESRGRPGERRGGAVRTPEVGCGSPGVNSWIGSDGPVVLLPNNDKF
jgi:hypothetical protein